MSGPEIGEHSDFRELFDALPPVLKNQEALHQRRLPAADDHSIAECIRHAIDNLYLSKADNTASTSDWFWSMNIDRKNHGLVIAVMCFLLAACSVSIPL
ncbi:hypothetical protein AAC723_28765 (plasmid) [Klebsiella pneumoniae]